jgi:hypothetical protein
MIGLIQKILLDMVRELGGTEALQEVKQRTGLAADFEYRIDTDYDNDEARRLLDNACAVLGVDSDTAFKHYAQHFLRDATERFPTFFSISGSARELLGRQPAIHNMLASGLRDAEKRHAINDKFAVRNVPGEPLEVRYQSPNYWCGLYFALAHEAGKHYGERVDIEVAQCRMRGDANCLFRLNFAPQTSDT